MATQKRRVCGVYAVGPSTPLADGNLSALTHLSVRPTTCTPRRSFGVAMTDRLKVP